MAPFNVSKYRTSSAENTSGTAFGFTLIPQGLRSLFSVCGFGLAFLTAYPVAAGPLTIMTQNMDEGTNYTALLSATTPAAFVAAVTQTYQEIAATQPAARAGAIAQEIASSRPAIVALQEASIVRTSISGPATTVTSDLLTSVLTSLNALGQHYAPVIVGTELDAQAPSTLGLNVRLTTQDVILARTDLTVSQLSLTNAQSHHFTTQLVVPTPVGPIPITRGWLSADVTVDGQQFRFVTTHLDTGEIAPSIQLAQAQELVSSARG
jgi:endonuclease/exonuclease/phosphatase family metal-dependent hydrolase